MDASEGTRVREAPRQVERLETNPRTPLRVPGYGRHRGRQQGWTLTHRRL